MKKITFLFALLCASVMAFAVDQDTWIPVNADGAAYANQFKWYAIDGVTTPNSVVEIQKPGFASQVGIYVTFADAAFNAVYYNGELKTDGTDFKQDGAGICFYVSALTGKLTEILIKNGETTRFGLKVYNDNGTSPNESEYCGYEGNETKSGDTYVTLTWETQENGDVLITMGTGTGATSCSFRNGGFEGGIDAFVVSTDNFETTTPASNYFTATQVYSGNTYRLVKTADLPDNAKIKHVGSGHAFSWTVNGNSAYTFPDFIYTYGGVCDASVFTDIKLSASAKIAKVGDEVTLNVKAVDQNGMPMDGIDIDLAVSPADMGSIEGNVFTFAKTGVATITASSAEIETSITLYGVPSDNLALNQTCEAGYEDGNSAETAAKANDGNTNTAWVTYADQPASKEWWYVDLEDTYSLTAVSVLWGDPASTSYILQVRTEAPSDEDKANDDAWETIKTVNEAGNNSEQFNVVNGVGRYMRLRSLTKSSNFLRLKEVRVFGTEPVVDNQKPVMVSAALESKTWNSAVIAVAATDNVGVTKYRVVNANPSIDVKLLAEDGKITVTGLTAATAYNFTITALDAVLNESENSKSVAVTTENDVPSEAAPTPVDRDAQWYRSLYSDTYTTALQHGFALQNWGSTVGTEKTIGENYYILYDMTGGTQVIWGENTDGANAIVAKEEYRGGGTGVDASSMEYLHMDIFSLVAMSNIKVLVNDNHLRTINLTDKGWQSFDIALENPVDAGVNLSNVRWFKIVDITDANRQKLAFDNIYFWREPVTTDTKAPTNVSATCVATGFKSITLALRAEDENNISYSVKIGDVAKGSISGASGETKNLTISNLDPGTEYTFTVVAKDLSDNAAAPINVVASTKALPASALAPTVTAANVKSLYSNSYDVAATVTNYCENWWAAPTLTPIVLGEDNNILLYTNIQSTSSFGWAFYDTPLNIEGYQKVHISIYPASAGTLVVVPISEGVSDLTSNELVAGEWNEVVFDYSEKTISTITQLGFRNIGALGEFFIDNVYFFKEESGSAIDNTVEATKVQKMIENGQLIIIKNGIRYNVAGQLVK